ncbi:universal stress protein [Xanthobacter sp. TB0139]|uniref:universal stress protein n=1 Tax=Xanthobacter sp. TB0139 TaxID=3459178 RepID=UPI0040390996
MLRRLLVLLGESAPSVAARQYAFRLAGESDRMQLAGLAGIDLVSLHIPTLGRAGAAAIQARLEEDLRQQSEELRQRLHESYQRECTRHGVPFEWLTFEGDPDEALLLAAETRDLLITGHDITFEARVGQPLSEMLSRLLAATPRPVVVCGDDVPEDGGILVAYDGSLPAMRALQMFTLIGLGHGIGHANGQSIRVLSIDASEEEAARRAEGAVSYLKLHGIEAEALPVASRADPTSVIRSEVERQKARTLVMGCYGRRGWRQMLFGSTTGKLVENPPCALFIYH